MQLMRYDQARHALAECRRVDEVKAIKDRAEALRVYAKQANDHELEAWAAEIALRAKRRAGEICAAMEKGTSAGPGRGKKQIPRCGICFRKSDALREAGLTTQAASRYERIAAIPEQTFEQLVAASAATHWQAEAAPLVAVNARNAGSSTNGEIYLKNRHFALTHADADVESRLNGNPPHGPIRPLKTAYLNYSAYV